MCNPLINIKIMMLVISFIINDRIALSIWIVNNLWRSLYYTIYNDVINGILAGNIGLD